jgi:hypothetical protein
MSIEVLRSEQELGEAHSVGEANRIISDHNRQGWTLVSVVKGTSSRLVLMFNRSVIDEISS